MTDKKVLNLNKEEADKLQKSENKNQFLNELQLVFCELPLLKMLF